MIRLLDLPWPGWIATSDREGVVEEISRELMPTEPYGTLRIEDLLNPASRLLVLGSMLPEIIASGRSEDVMLRLDVEHMRETPVVCSAKLDPDGTRIRWLFLSAPRRDEAERRLLALQRDAARQAQQMEREANIDALTGIPNRRWFFSAFRNIDQPLTGVLAILDIDHFKTINDTFGHLAGDRVIKTTAQVLVASIRERDLLARLGGEEFILWAPGLFTTEEALLMGDRIRRRIESTDFALEGRRVTVSVGLCLLDRISPNRLFNAIEKADEALYEAKRAGRNQVRLRLWDVELLPSEQTPSPGDALPNLNSVLPKGRARSIG